ncbi:VCBS repeat-containing protein [Pelagicoccus sp. NFK12]|uniref:VCBS repeat-containing protein n=1 Tax=Pelagicoccus enzymogenes TaxID=2773457 RepID=A0A927IH40_9BACT|nr:FG-GAP-like repeat-containing protein [Pelagicoccus enzymogenes]MBD5781857.1 VCBS repeat-containing protein [Pelagicoccus enzymogenes]
MFSFFRSCGCISLAVSFLALASRDAFSAFSDVSGQMGISYLHSRKTDPVNNHGGAAVVDVNGDGHSDLIFARYGKAPLLYVNDGTGSFSEEAAARGLGGALDAAGFGAGDFDNDGDQDLYLSVHRGSRFFLYINDGTGNFTEEAVARGADLAVSESDHQAYSVGLVDYDLDGFLDLYVSEWGIEVDGERALHSALLRNRGTEAPGHFEVVTEQAGLLQPVKTTRQNGFSTAWSDFDGDGWPDLALVADYGKSQMYWNDGDGTFTQSTKSSGVGFDENGMGVAVADYDGDGLLDFYVSSIYDEFSNEKKGSHTGNKLYKNMGGRNFQEVSVPAGVSRTGWGWGAAFFEYDNDGWFDLVVTNGMPIAEGADRNTTPYADADDDPTTLFRNLGDGTFQNATVPSGIADKRYGKALLVLDWDSDGDEDLVVVNSHSDPVFYESDASENGNDWIRLTLKGQVSNADAIGATVVVTDGGMSRTLSYNPSNAYIGQREAALHFGLGASDGVVDSITISWPTGLRQTIENVSANQVLELVEPSNAPLPPRISSQPVAEDSYRFGSPLDLSVEATGSPTPLFVWEKDGETIEGESASRLRLKRLAPFDAGTYRVKAINAGGSVYSAEVEVRLDIDLSSHSVARWWNEFMLEAIRKDFPDPTKHSRNLYHVSAAMWDAYWAYEEEAWSRAVPMFHQEDVDQSEWGADRLSAQREAISHAAYAVLRHRYQNSPGSERSLAGFRWLMEQYGFDPEDDSMEGMSPAAVGNRIGAGVLEGNYDDGSNELNGYADTSGYKPVNGSLVLELSGTDMNDLNRWQPLAFDYAVSQNGIPLGALVQTFLGVNWREVATFAMGKPTHNTIAFDPGPPPLWGTDTHEDFVDAAIEVIRFSSYLDPHDSTRIDISPGARLNNPLATNEGVGRPINPVTGEAYASNSVKRADYGRILAEYWADGPASETPPGHWNTLHNEISDFPDFERRYMGQGEELSALEWDVRAYLALNGGMHDAAVGAWGLKAQYDYSRPISMIRGLAGLGQASDPDAPRYHSQGIKLVPGLIELVTADTAAADQRHERLADHVGEIAILAWAGEPEDSHSEVGGVDWILAADWFPYQRSTFVTPAFAAYVSGHSTFSRSGAEVMTLLTGSPFFPGGIGEFHFPQGEFLEFEYGPSEDVTLQWATYYDAADQAGISRLYGGIHVRADDFIGRTLGARVGVESFLRAHEQRNANQKATGLIKEIHHVGKLGLGETSPLVRIDSEGTRLPQRSVFSLSDQSFRDRDGIYFRFSGDPGAEGFEAGTMAISGIGPLKGADFEAQLKEGESLAVDVEIEALEPELVLAYAEGAGLGAGILDTRVTVFSIAADGVATKVASNDNWRFNDTSSQAEVLLLRESSDKGLHEKDAATSVALEAGLYRFVLEAVSGEGTVVLGVRGQAWRHPF